MRRLQAMALALAVGLAAAPSAQAQSAITVNRARAISAYKAMQHAYYDASAGLYRDTVSKWADAWPYSQAMAATISVAALPGLHRQYRSDLEARLDGLEDYADHINAQPAGYDSELAPPRGPGGQRYNDDNEWIGIELIRLDHLASDNALLPAAERQLELVYSQWDTSTTHACPGGVPWETLTPGSTRNTVSNATGAELGAQLYEHTHNVTYLKEAFNMYFWVRDCLLNSDGLYGDHIDNAGDIDPTEWTYNQGTMIGAGVMLFQATRDRRYLNQAVATAQKALATFSPEALAQQPISFNAIYVRNLLLLGAATGDPRYKNFASWFAGDAWSNVLDPVTGLFNADPGGTTQLGDQAAMVQVYALLASAPSTYF